MKSAFTLLLLLSLLLSICLKSFPVVSLLFLCSHDEFQKTADWLMSQTQHRPQVAIICGSGLGMLADTLKCQDSFAYSDIPGFPQSTGNLDIQFYFNCIKTPISNISYICCLAPRRVAECK